MDVKEQNQGEAWYQGLVKKSGGEYVLDTGDEQLEISETGLVEQVWHDLSADPEEVMLYGELEMEETLTGRERYSLENPSKAGYILNQDYDGRQVLLSGYDLVFLDGDEEITYEADGFEEMRDNLKGWFDEEEEDEVLKNLENLKLEKDYWPWGINE